MTSPIPFTPEKWKELEPQGWRFGVKPERGNPEERHLVGISKDGFPVWQSNTGVLCEARAHHKDPVILPPRQVIEFKVGLFNSDRGAFLHMIGEFNWLETADNFIRLLTKDEMREGVVEI